MNKFSNHYTLMFVPEDNRRTFSLRIPKYVFYVFVFFVVIFFSGLILLLFKSGEIAAKLQVLSLIRMENEKLIKENLELRLIAEKIYNLDKLSRYLYKISLPLELPDKNVKTEIHPDTSNYAGVINQQLQQKTGRIDNFNALPTLLPVDGWITKTFVYDTSLLNNGHQGVDFAAAEGTPIKASSPGVVRNIQNDKYFGLLVTLQHEGGFVTRYGHCSQILVSVHERVNRGQTIALVGNTGRSSGPHLHYEVIKDGRYIDPLKHILAHKE